MSSTIAWRNIRLSAVAAVALAAAFGAATGASAYTFKLLHAFCASAGCADGRYAVFPPELDANGVLYGVTNYGGGNNSGVVYRLVPNGTGYDFKVLHKFCLQTGCPDGANPSSSLVIGANAILYGTTSGGGAYGHGTVFKLVPNAARTKWTYVTLYDFCPQGGSCVDGSAPFGNLTYQGAQTGALYDGKSPLYGGTGGAAGQETTGVAFQLARVAGVWKETVLYTFCQEPNCLDGQAPIGATIDAKGDLFSASELGGRYNEGAVTEIDPKQKLEGVVYSFCPQINCPDGLDPLTPLSFDATGDILGTTHQGGGIGGGTVFEIVPNGAVSTEKVLYSFCRNGLPCMDGVDPVSGVTLDSSGNMFGTTQFGGAFNTNCEGTGAGCGTVFKLQGTTHTVLHSFCRLGLPDCSDGAEPLFGPPALDASGSLFGTTSRGGRHDGGTVFELTP